MTEMKDCPQLAASEATLPPLGALKRWKKEKKVENRQRRAEEGSKIERSTREKNKWEAVMGTQPHE